MLINAFSFCGTDADSLYADFTPNRFRDHARKAYMKELVIEGQPSYEEIMKQAKEKLGDNKCQLEQVWSSCIRQLVLIHLTSE